MTSSPTDRRPGGRVRETYEEYDLGDARVGVVGDPRNGHAWILSDDVRRLER